MPPNAESRRATSYQMVFALKNIFFEMRYDRLILLLECTLYGPYKQPTKRYTLASYDHDDICVDTIVQKKLRVKQRKPRGKGSMVQVPM